LAELRIATGAEAVIPAIPGMEAARSSGFALTMDEVMDELRGPVAWVADGTVTPALSNAELQAILDEEVGGFHGPSRQTPARR
jgi:hypothetical protein